MELTKSNFQYNFTVFYLFLLFTLANFDYFNLNEFVLWVIGPILAIVSILFYTKKPFRLSPQLYVFAIFIIISFIATQINALSIERALRFNRLHLSMLIFMFIIQVAIVNSFKIDEIIKTIFYSSIFVCVSSLLTTTTLDISNLDEMTRMEGILPINALAQSATAGIICSIYLYRSESAKIMKYIYLASNFIFVYVSIATASRGAFTCLLISLVVYIYLVVRKNKATVIVFPVITALIVISLLTWLPNFLEGTVLGERLFQRTDELLESDKRDDLYILGLMAFADYPMLGTGMGNFYNYSAINHYGSVIKSSIVHSDYVGILAEAGIIGAILYYLVYLLTLKDILISLRKSDKLQSKKVTEVLNLFIILFIQLLFYGLVRENYYTIPAFLTLAIIFSYTRILNYKIDAINSEQRNRI